MVVVAAEGYNVIGLDFVSLRPTDGERMQRQDRRGGNMGDQQYSPLPSGTSVYIVAGRLSCNFLHMSELACRQASAYTSEEDGETGGAETAAHLRPHLHTRPAHLKSERRFDARQRLLGAERMALVWYRSA